MKGEEKKLCIKDFFYFFWRSPYLAAPTGTILNKRIMAGIIIDNQGVDMQQYYRDTEACSSFATQVPVAEKATTSAVGGALVGGGLRCYCR